MLVSNDPYRLGRALGSGTRPRLDGGVLGIAALQAGAAGDEGKRMQEWAAPSFEVHSDAADRGRHRRRGGKARPAAALSQPATGAAGAHRPQHPGASPSAALPQTPWHGVRDVVRVAIRGSLPER